MSSIKVIIQYNGKELTLDIEINEDNIYNTFIDIFRQKFREEDINKKYKLTSINTSIPYLIIDENNIINIFKEKIEKDEPLKILVTVEDEEEIKRDSKDENFFRGFIKGAQQDEDDFEDNDFVILDENGNDLKTENIINKNNNKININNDLIEDNKEEKEKEIYKLLTNSLSNDKEDKKINKNENIIEHEKESDIDNNLLLNNIENINQISIEDNQNNFL